MRAAGRGAMGRLLGEAARRKLVRATRHPFVRVGMPMLLLMTASLAGMTQFVQGKKELEAAARGKRSLTQREFDLEEEHRRVLDKLANEYKIVPIPRPKE